VLFVRKPIPDEKNDQANQKSDTCKNDDLQYTWGNGGSRIRAAELLEGTNNAVRSTGKSHNTGGNVHIAFKNSLCARIFETIHKDWSLTHMLVSDASGGHSLLSGCREPEVLNHFHERFLEKKLGGKADDTKGNDDYENKKDNTTELRHGVDHSSGIV
jgi:hypothetical protein